LLLYCVSKLTRELLDSRLDDAAAFGLSTGIIYNRRNVPATQYRRAGQNTYTYIQEIVRYEFNRTVIESHFVFLDKKQRKGQCKNLTWNLKAN